MQKLKIIKDKITKIAKIKDNENEIANSKPYESFDTYKKCVNGKKFLEENREYFDPQELKYYQNRIEAHEKKIKLAATEDLKDNIISRHLRVLNKFLEEYKNKETIHEKDKLNALWHEDVALRDYRNSLKSAANLLPKEELAKYETQRKEIGKKIMLKLYTGFYEPLMNKIKNNQEPVGINYLSDWLKEVFEEYMDEKQKEKIKAQIREIREEAEKMKREKIENNTKI